MPSYHFGIEHAGARLERDLLRQRAHGTVAARLVADVDGHRLAALGAPHGARDAAERVEVRVDGGDAEFDRIEVLVGELHVGQHALQQRPVLHGAPAATVGKALALRVRLGEFVLVVPAAAVDQVIDVGAVRALGIAEHAQRRALEIAAVLRLVAQGVLADEVHFLGLIGRGGQERSLGEQLDLQRQQVAEDAGERDDHVDARPAEFRERQQRGAREPAVTVEARHGAEQGESLADRAAFGFQVVRAPQHERDGLGQRVAVVEVTVEQQLGEAGTVAHGERARDAERIEPVHVATGRQHLRCAQQIASRRGTHVPAVERAQDAVEFTVLHQQAVGAGEFTQRGNLLLRAVATEHVFGRGALDERLDRGTVLHRCRCRFGHGLQQVGTLGGSRRATDDVHAVRNQRVLEFQHGGGDTLHLFVAIGGPLRLDGGEFELGRLQLDQCAQVELLGRRFRFERAPAIERRLEVHQAAVQPGARDGWRQVADQRRARAALGDRAFRRVVRCIQVEIGQVADQAFGPAGAGEAGLLARHELERAVRAEMQHRMGAEVLAQVTVERRERVRRRVPTFEQQLHRVAFVAHAGLYGDQRVAELRAQHEDRAAVAELASGRRTPRRFDFLEPALAAHVIVHGDARVHVGVGAELRRVAVQDAIAQFVHAGRYVDGIAFALQRLQCLEQAFEDGEERSGAGVAGVGREVEQHQRHLALGAFAATKRDELRDTRGERLGAVRAGEHVLRAVLRTEGAAAVATRAGRAVGTRTAAEHDGAGCAVEFRDRHHDGAFDRQQSPLRRAPLADGLEFDRVRGEVGHVEIRQHFFGGARVVVGRTADEREARQRHDGIDDRPPVLHEELFDRRARIESGREGGYDAQPPGLEGRDHAVVVLRIAGQQVRAQHQQAHRAPGVGIGDDQRQFRNGIRNASRHPWVIDAGFRVVHGRLRFDGAAQHVAWTGGIAVHEEADHVLDVLVGPGEPVLQRHEVRAHVLGRARDEAQQLRDPAQHLHLLCAAGRGIALAAAQALQQRDRPIGGLVHVEAADTREFHDFSGRHGADDRIALRAARLQGVEHGQEVFFHEQHRRDHDVAASDVGPTALERTRVRRPFRSGVQAEREAGQVTDQRCARAVHRRCQVGVHRYDDHPDGCRVSGRSALSRHTASRW